MATYFENGRPVDTQGPDIYFDERDDLADDADPITALRKVLRSVLSEETTELLMHKVTTVVSRETLNLVISSPDPGLQAKVMGVMLGIGYAGCTEQAIASEYGCTRAAISSRANNLRDALQLRPVGPLRHDATRERCAKSRVLAALT